MIRMQIQLPEDRARALRDLARSEGRSISDVVREAVGQFMTQGARPDREELARRARELRGRFRSGVPDLAEGHDRHLADSFDP